MRLMSRLCGLVITALALGGLGLHAAGRPAGAGAQAGGASGSVRFEAIDVFVDSGDQPLSAYQFELKAPQRDGYQALIVGVEGGEHGAYAKPPYYDPAALQQDRIIIAAYSVDEQLPTGKTRVARLHMQLRPVDASKKMAERELAQRPADAGEPPAAPGTPARPAARAGSDDRAAGIALRARIDYTVELITAASRDGTPAAASAWVAPAGAEKSEPTTSGGNP